MDTKKPDNSQNEDNMSRGLNRRSALKRIIGSSTVILGFPLSVSAWGQPSSPFGSSESTNSGSQMLSSSGSNQSLLTMAPTLAPIDCEYIPTGAPTTTAPTESPTSSPTTSPTQSPTSSPTTSPTQSPTSSPTTSPTQSPTSSPTTSPTQSPLPAPTQSPLPAPTQSPIGAPQIPE